MAPQGDRWPEQDLEQVPRCPVCSSDRRTPLFDDLEDKTFGVAPGRWSLFRCDGCTAAWLDPRPSRDSIHRAYEVYYTHSATPGASASDLGRLDRLKRALANGYCNWRYGSRYEPASPLGVPFTLATQANRRRLDLRFRYLPRPGPGSRVLDLGFGAGTFIEAANAAGWQAEGVDIDDVAVQSARARGLRVERGGIEVYAGQAAIFDAITMSHVIEHVHDPLAVLRDLRALLKPGGTLFVDTPNLDATGLVRFGRDWRGLEPPRHLVLFTRASLQRALADAGFSVDRWIARPEVASNLYPLSEKIRRGAPLSRGQALRARLLANEARIRPGGDEFLTVIARRA